MRRWPSRSTSSSGRRPVPHGAYGLFRQGAYTTAILNTVYHWPVFATMPIAGVLAAIFAFVLAKPIIHLRGDYLLIVTIGIVEIVRIALTNNLFGLTGGANGIYGIAGLPCSGWCSRRPSASSTSSGPSPS